MMRSASGKWQDWASFALGLWLAMSPWLLDYARDEAATANAAVVGLVVALGSHFEVSFDEVPVEWFNLAAGAWLIAAPFVLAFTSRPAANALVVGAALSALAASVLARTETRSALR